MEKNKIVVVGGGYAGVLTVKGLIKKLKKQIKAGEVEITLVDKQPYHVLMTELHEAAFDRTNFEAIRVYHKKIFNEKYVNLVLDEVTSIDYENKKLETVTTESGIEYDYLVEATGAKVTYFGVEGAEEFTYPMWSYKDTRDVYAKVLENFELAEREPDANKRRELLTFVVAGAGFTGVEVVGELKEWIDRTLIYRYPTILPEEISVHLIDGAPRILNSFGEKAAAKAHKYMEKKLNIEITLNSFISKVTADSVTFGDNQTVKSSCVIWTSGITCDPINPQGYEICRGNRIPVSENLEIIGQSDAYVLGDIMYYIPENQECPVPQMVENCEHAAPIVANNIATKIKGTDKTKSYNPAFHGAMACIGGRYGVAELKFGKFSPVFSGFIAMFIKHFINVLYLFMAAGIAKVWNYIRVEFFEVRDERSFIGGHLSHSTPSIYLVPLRIWLGWYWIAQGAPKVIAKLAGGWEEVCVKTEIFPAKVKEYGDFCRQVFPEGEKQFDALYNADAATSASTAAGSADAAASASTAVEAATQAADAATSASTVVETTAEAVQSAPEITGILGQINDFFASIAPTSTPYGMGYDLGLLPDFLTDFINNIGMWMLEMIAGFEWLLELVFDFAELGLGLLLVIGLFTEFAAVALTILAAQIAVGSFLNYGIIVEGLFFSITAAVALIGIGGKGAQPLSVDYFLRPFLKKRKLKKRKNK